eukprot:scaffold30241_cov89-Isochrysis_galbana.AAC.2
MTAMRARQSSAQVTRPCIPPSPHWPRSRGSAHTVDKPARSSERCRSAPPAQRAHVPLQRPRRASNGTLLLVISVAYSLPHPVYIRTPA